MVKMLQKSEYKLNHENEEEKLPHKESFFQIDVLKAIMIFLVIFDHTIPWTIKDNLGVVLWERISIPVFMVIMGFNIGKSLQRERLKKKIHFNLLC